MTNANAARGARWEKALVDFFRALLGRQAVVKPRQEGYVDVGDIHVSPFVLQAKDEKAHAFASYVRDAEAQAAAAEEDFGVAVVKRRGVGTGQGYAVMTVASFLRLVSRLRRAEGLLLRASPASYDAHCETNNREKDTL